MPPPPLTIDGSQGEGGGQILRTSMALAAITQTPVRITSIRANRDKPGLQRQHLTAVQSAAQVCNGKLEGAELQSTEITFTPGPIRGGDFALATGSAGSVTLVLQTVLPILLHAPEPSKLTLVGGTHNIFAPPADFLIHAFLPQLQRMGANVGVQLERYGFYPAGGGRLSATITPGKLSPLELLTRGATPTSKSAVGIVADLPGEIAVRELALVKKRLSMDDTQARPLQLPSGQGPGNILLVRYDFPEVTEILTAHGKKGITAEAVAEHAITQARDYLKVDAPVGEHLADQLLLPLALAGAGRFITSTPSLHTTTNIAVIEKFLPVKFEIKDLGKHRHEISVAHT